MVVIPPGGSDFQELAQVANPEDRYRQDLVGRAPAW
ncbi:hypothetical protein PC116_g31886 [Phytophthora cactorum]|nr:hypothetical protein PC116_g31886 [Phytophthora cactorum]